MTTLSLIGPFPKRMGGVGLAVAGLLRLSLALMIAGFGLWVLSVAVWELATGRFH